MSNYAEDNIKTIIYDENLKELLRIARNSLDPKNLQIDPYIKKIDNEYFYFTSTKIIKAQETLREIFTQNKSTLNFILTEENKNKYTMPNFYAFCAAFINDFENCNCWDNIFKDAVNSEVRLFGSVKKNKLDNTQEFITETNKFPITNGRKCQCCCSHDIKIIYFMVSKTTGYSMMTGNCCIEKHYIKNPKIMNELKTIEDKQKEKNKKEMKENKEKEKKDKKDIEEKEKKEIKNRLNAINSKVYFPKYRGTGLSYLEVSKIDTKYLKLLIENDYIKINDKYPNNAYIIEWIKNLNI